MAGNCAATGPNARNPDLTEKLDLGPGAGPKAPSIIFINRGMNIYILDSSDTMILMDRNQSCKNIYYETILNFKCIKLTIYIL